MERTVQIDRDRALLFDAAAERYDRIRPGYPDAVIDAVLGPSPGGLSVLDVACGTGKAARAMAARGAQVLGVDLNPGMAAVAARHGITTEVAAFESWDPAGRRFDLVTCAQAWHWLEPVASAAAAASVLRPGGRLCLFWSAGHYPDALADAMAATYRRVADRDARLTIGYGMNRSTDATDFGFAADALRDSGWFAEPATVEFPWTRHYTRDEWLDELLTHSDHLALPDDLRGRLLDELAVTLDGFGGGFDMVYRTIVITAVRR